MAKGSVCVISSDGEGDMEWLGYSLESAGWEAQLFGLKEARAVDLSKFDFAIFNLHGRSLTRNDILRRLEGFAWQPGRTIVRFDFGHTFHGTIEGLHPVDQMGTQSNQADAYISFMEPVRA